MTTIHAIRTGLVQVRRPQMESRGSGLARMTHMLFDEEWSDWLPVYAWAIEHDEGIIVVDTGETWRVHRTRVSPALAPVLPARGTLLGASRGGARRAVARDRHRPSRRPPGRAHAPPHRSCRRTASRDRKPRVGLARGARARQWSCRASPGLLAASLAEMVAAGIHPLRSSIAGPFHGSHARDAARRYPDCPDTGSHTVPRLGSCLR